MLVFVLYKKEAARVEAMLQRKAWNVRGLRAVVAAHACSKGC